MGAWSYHPMGSDLAWDVRDEFFDRIFQCVSQKKLEKCDNTMTSVLEVLTVTDLKKICGKEAFWGNNYVIPYVFVENGAIPKDDKVKLFLRKCLDNHEYLGSTEEEFDKPLTQISMKKLKETFPCLVYIKDFINNFDDYIMQRKPLKQDEGLFAALSKK